MKKSNVIRYDFTVAELLENVPGIPSPELCSVVLRTPDGDVKLKNGFKIRVEHDTNTVARGQG